MPYSQTGPDRSLRAGVTAPAHRPGVAARHDGPVLIVFAGRPGTGKTTLSRRLAGERGAALLRVDAIETAVVRSGWTQVPIGPVGYVVTHEVAGSCLAVGLSVVVDAVNPVAEARRGWWGLATGHGVALAVIEVQLTDAAEHQRRVSARRPDLVGQRVPTWEEVRQETYEPWDDARDGRRLVVDGADTDAALARIRAYVDAEVSGPSTPTPDDRRG